MADSPVAGNESSTGKHSGIAIFWKRLIKEKPLGTIGGIITLLLLLTGIFADFLAPYGMNEVFSDHYLAPPGGKFWLGADNVGRDVLSRVIYGARISVIVGLSGAGIATILSLIIGGLSGYFGGKIDLFAQRLVDIRTSIPNLLLLMVIIAIIGPGMWQVIITLGISWGIGGSRIIRGAAIAVRENAYMKAADSIGCSHVRIIMKHLLPNIMAPAIVLYTARVPNVILTEAALSFLGFGIPPPFPSWGGMLSGSGRSYMFDAPWMVIWPGLALAAVVFGINLFGDAVRDLLDPRLKGGGGSYGMHMKKTTSIERKKGGTKQ